MNVDYDKVEKLAKEVLKDKRDFSFDLRQSKKSESLYLSVHYENLTNTIRISDHKNVSKHRYRTEIVSNKINLKCLKRTIENVCERLHMIRVYDCLRLLSTQRDRCVCSVG